MEYLESDLAELVKLGPKSGISELHLQMIIYNVLCAMKFLHSANVIHRDIKPSNILVNKLC
jgi:serine/threonine protein kinase